MHKGRFVGSLEMDKHLSAYSVLRVTLLISASLLATSMSASGEQRMISIGDRRLAVYCDGQATRSRTVILISPGANSAEEWGTIQPAISNFTRVCSYDHANAGQSDKAPFKLESVDQAVDDLHAWLTASGEKGPFVLVSHSIAGLYARRFVTRYPQEVAGLVFIDSAHEEQMWRLHEIDPQGPPLSDITAQLGFYIKGGQRLDWHTELPLIVLGRGLPTPRRARDGSDSQTNRMTEEQFAEWDRTWRELQKDLANRSTRGEFRVAERSGHFIQRDQPDLVIQAIRDVSMPRQFDAPAGR